MSDSQQYETVITASDGVTVEKRFEEDEFPVPAIAFEITSGRSETVTLTLVDEVPESVAVEDLGFHPEYGSEYWTIDEDSITFEREIEADSEYTTVYGIRATGTDDVEQFLTDPIIESVDPPLAEDPEDVVQGSGSDVVRDVISGDSEGVPGLEDDEDDDIGTLDLKDPNEPEQEEGDAGVAAAEADGDSGASEDATAEAGGGSGGGGLADADIDASTLCGALATELRNGNVEEEDVKLLRKAFDLAAEDTGSVEARIKRLQTEVADLLAYTDALEEFLDESGTSEVIEDLRAEVEGLQTDLAEAKSLAESHEDALGSLESTVDSVESSMETLESDMDTVLGEIDEVSEEVDDVSAEVDEVATDVDEVSEEVDEFRDELDEIESQVGDIDVTRVESDIDEIEDEINELKEWREQLSSVIGG